MKDIMQFSRVNENTTEILIYGEIRPKSFWTKVFEKELEVQDDSVGAASFKEMLDQVETPNILVRINSMGGSVSEGLSIYSLLNDFDGTVTTQVDGFACSAASVIFMAGDVRKVPESGLLMIHNAWSNATGDSKALLKAAEDLEKITQPSVNIYVSKTGLDESRVKAMMDRETWIDSKEAYDLGFATAIEKTEAYQSINDRYLHKLIMKSKEQEVLIAQLTTKIENFNKADEDDDSFF